MTTRRTLLGVAAASVATLAAPRLAKAAWPADRAIEVIVPFPPGGGVDNMVRPIVHFVTPRLQGARFAVVNRPGAAGVIADRVARFCSSSNAIDTQADTPKTARVIFTSNRKANATPRSAA